MASFQNYLLKLTVGGVSGRFKKDLVQVKSLRKWLNSSAKSLKVPDEVEVIPIEIQNLKAEILQPEDARPGKTLLFLHGGGYALGSLQTHRSVAARLAQICRARVITIDYRLAPEYPFPAALEDATLAYEWLLENGTAAEDIVVMGDSAGGGLSIALMVLLKRLKRELPSAAVLMSPWVDLSGLRSAAFEMAADDPIVPANEVGRWARMYAGDAGTQHPLVSPIKADLSALPPVLVQVSSREVLTEQVLRFSRKLTEAGVPTEVQLFDDVMHVWQLFWRFLPEAQDALNKIARFVEAQWEEVSLAESA